MRVKDILHNYFDIEVRSIQKLEGGYRNQCFKVVASDKAYNLIIYKREEGIEEKIRNANFVSSFLNDRGFPTRVPIMSKRKTDILETLFQGEKRFVCLYTFLEGETIPWEAYTKRHLKSMGRTLSDMHFALKGLSDKDEASVYLNWKEDVVKEIKEMKKYLKEVEPWIKKKLRLELFWEEIESNFSFTQKIEGKNNILHYDFVRGNILFSDVVDKKLDIYPITGILDFEKVCVGPEVVDIARSLAFLLVDCKYKDEKTIRKRFLVSGYDKRGKNPIPIKDFFDERLEILVLYFLLRDFWKFLENNPYEFLHMNEHYKRTVNQLVQRNAVTRV